MGTAAAVSAAIFAFSLGLGGIALHTSDRYAGLVIISLVGIAAGIIGLLATLLAALFASFASASTDMPGDRQEYEEDWMPDDEPPKQSKVQAALKGVAVCICCLVAAFGIGLHSLCGPNGAIGYNGGNSPAGVVVLACIVVVLASAVGLLVYFVRLLIALGNR